MAIQGMGVGVSHLEARDVDGIPTAINDLNYQARKINDESYSLGLHRGCLKMSVHIDALDADGNVTDSREADLGTKQLAQFIQVLILASAQTITDTTDTGRAISNGTATGTLQIVAGTGGTGATVVDYVLQAQTASTSGYIAATVNAYSGSGSSGSFTVTGTISNTSGGTVTYSEVGQYITVGGNVFMLSHDTFTGLPVGSGGTLAVTYTYTIS